MTNLGKRSFGVVLFLCVSLAARAAHGAELKILLPQGRTAFPTNEWIDVSVVRSSPQAPDSTCTELDALLPSRPNSANTSSAGVEG